MKYSYITFPNIGYYWQAFQAVVFAPLHPNLQTNCWIQDQVYDFSNENEIIPIIPFGAYDINETCTWRFTVPDGFKLKVNVRQWETYAGESFNISSNSGDFQEIQRPDVYYFNGNSFVIQYFKISHPRDGIGVVAFVSAVNTSANSKASGSEVLSAAADDCIKKDVYDNKTLVFYNLDYQNGYKNNLVSNLLSFRSPI